MSPSETIISISSLSKQFSGGLKAVDNISLDIKSGEFFALLGPSGCGKTTLLRMLAGLEVPSEGQVRLDGQDMTYTPPNKRPLNMVFQSYAVFPHMSVEDNVSYGLKMEKGSADEIKSRVSDALEQVQLAGFAQAMPHTLSGGQRQRVALARALVKQPKVLLLDEPLSALDAKLREAMQNELVRLQKSVGITFIFVTHDQSEALTMASRIAVMNKGRIVQTAPPHELYEKPASRFVADFIGKMNFLSGRITTSASDGLAICELAAGQKIQVRTDETEGRSVTVGIRPERLRLSVAGSDTDEQTSLEGQLEMVSYHGTEHRAHIRADDGTELIVSIPNAEAAAIQAHSYGERLRVEWTLSDARIFAEQDS